MPAAAAHRDRDAARPGVLDGVREGLAADEVRGALDLRREVARDAGVERERNGRADGERLQRRGEAVAAQGGGALSADERAQLGQRAFGEVAAAAGQDADGGIRVPRAVVVELGEGDQQGDQRLLGAVVQVALDAVPFLISGPGGGLRVAIRAPHGPTLAVSPGAVDLIYKVQGCPQGPSGWHGRLRGEMIAPMPEQTLRVVIADDSVLLREALASLLAGHGFEVLACVGTAGELLEAVAAHGADVALVDIRMPPTHTDEGLRAAQALAERAPDLGVVVLSQYLDPRVALRMLKDGTPGRAYLLKDHIARVEVLVEAVRAVAAGGSYVDPSVVAPLVRSPSGSEPLAKLSPRELDILALMAQGRSNRAICGDLFLSPKTVEAHVRNLFLKLDLPPAPDDHRRVLAVLRYLGSPGDGGYTPDPSRRSSSVG